MKQSIARELLGVSEISNGLAALGWAFFGNWHFEQSKVISRQIRKHADVSEIDLRICELWNERQPVLLRNIAMPLGRYGRGVDLEFQRRCQQRQTLINEAIQCHFEGKYASSIVLTLAQIDGLTREIVGSSFFRSKVGETDHDYTDDATLAGIDGNLPIVRKAFSQPVPEVGRYGLVSRHGVVHGQDLSYATKVNSTKTLVLLGALIEQLETKAESRAAKWRRKRDIERSRLTGVDDTGRLRDDRGLEEICLFRGDIGVYVLNKMVLCKDLSEQSLMSEAYKRLDERRLPRSGFRLLELGDDRVSWTYKAQNGHFLGAATQYEDLDARPLEPLEWTWDYGEEPGGSPWDGQNGWTRAINGEPQTPNWAFRDFYSG